MDPSNYSTMDFETLNRLQALYVEAANAFLGRSFAKAAACLEEQYKIIDEQQQLLQRRFHKGWQLHNWGVALLNLDRQEEGYGKILLAYVEDVLTVEAGSEDDADNGLAGKTLRDAGEEEGLLRAVKEIARRRKEAGEPTFVPDLILNEAQARPRARLTATGTLEPLQLLSS